MFPITNAKRKLLTQFKKEVRAHYRKHGRSLPWRMHVTPYKVFVSEVMLQQTQVDRVIPKYKEFIRTWPSFTALASASQAQVVALWNGLGYNRRAQFLHKSAKIIVRDFKGKLPKDSKSLRVLPGIGTYTAGAIQAFAYNIPTIFIETNIRSAYLHFFFEDKADIDDQELVPLIEQTLDRKNPREWYFALMDYGAWVKKEYGNPNIRSKQYVRQSAFKGSPREARGALLKLLISGKHNESLLLKKVQSPHTKKALRDLLKEGMVKKRGNYYLLT